MVPHSPMAEDAVESAAVGEEDKVLLREVLDNLDVMAVDVQLIFKGVDDMAGVSAWLLPLSQHTIALPMISSLLNLMAPVAVMVQIIFSGRARGSAGYAAIIVASPLATCR